MPTTPYVSRVNQIDAAQLDDEIYKVLRDQAQSVIAYLPAGKTELWRAEVDALLGFLAWNFSLRRGRSTFGQQLLNLEYVNIDRTKSVLYLLLTVLPAYLRDKLTGRGIERSILDRVARLLDLTRLLDSLIFLHRGTQPLVIELLLGISSRPITAHKPRNIGYSYMTRELLWHGLMELFAVGLPIINFHRLRYATKRLLRSAGGPKAPREPRPTRTMNLSTKCAYCNDFPILPSHADCVHVFCYYCLEAHFTATRAFQCPECGIELHAENMRSLEATASARHLH